MTLVFPSRFGKVLRKCGYKHMLEVPYKNDTFAGVFEKAKGMPAYLKPERYTYAVSDPKLTEADCYGLFRESDRRSMELRKGTTVKEFAAFLAMSRMFTLVEWMKEEVESVGLKFELKHAEEMPQNEAEKTDTVFLIPGTDVTIMNPRTQQPKTDSKPDMILLSPLSEDPLVLEGNWSYFEVKHWLRQLQQGGDECIVCMEETGAGSTQLSTVGCPLCTATMCLPCFVDLILIGGDYDVNSGFSQFSCVCCRKPIRHSLLEIAETIEFCTRLKTGFSDAKALFIGILARIAKAKKPHKAETMCAVAELTESMKRVIRGEIERKKRGECDGCGKLFESVRKRKSAAKCKRCKRVSYCSTRCRKTHLQEHVVECTAHKKKRRRRN